MSSTMPAESSPQEGSLLLEGLGGPPWVALVLIVLAVWRLTHLLHAEDGPWRLFARARQAAGGGMVGAMLTCFYCASLWVAAPFAWLASPSWPGRAILWLAFSAGAIFAHHFLERLAEPRAGYPRAEEPSAEEPVAWREMPGPSEGPGSTDPGSHHTQEKPP
ncbi:MAG: DUF1360 domain-containing protein [Holophagales bacterium]|nr:DUF1360 domain-containing protein [Holophagales bacterium]